MLIAGLLSLLTSCSEKLEKELLKPKSYFEESFAAMEVRQESSVTYPLKARVSTPLEEPISITYHLGTEADVEAYNQRNGTSHLLYPTENVTLEKTSSDIPSGSVYSSPINVEIKGLEAVEEGKVFLVPVHFDSSCDIEPIKSAQTMFIALQKPVQVKKVGHFYSSRWDAGDWITVPRLSDESFESVTYEALIHSTGWTSNNTVMGVEGRLILRIGDEGGGLARNKIQIAGNKQFHYDTGLNANKWYHVAFTFNHTTGKAFIYINGKQVANGDWDQIADIRENFAIGQVPHFMWGTRPFQGYMSEVRLWNVARTEAEIQQNMLRVDPKSNGLIVYYHLNGEDVVQEDGKWRVLDATGHGYHGEPNDGDRELKSYTLPTPLEAKDIK